MLSILSVNKKGFYFFFRNEKKPNFVEHKVKKHGYSHGLTVIADYDPNNAVDGTIQHAGATRVHCRANFMTTSTINR